MISLTDGFSGLNISKVASKAEVDRKLAYDYFGSMEGLVKECLNNSDFYTADIDQSKEIIGQNRSNQSKKMLYYLLEDRLDSLIANEEMRKIISWGCAKVQNYSKS